MARLRRRYLRLLIFLLPIVFLISICLYLTLTSNVTDIIFKSKPSNTNIIFDLAKEVKSNGILIDKLKKETNFLVISTLQKTRDHKQKITKKSKTVTSVDDKMFLNRQDKWCPSENIIKSKSDVIDMLEVYEKLNFDNPDGGVWKQGYDITYNANKDWSQTNQLNVYVVPHSHNDPGWLKTYTDYYDTETKFIFENMVRYMQQEPRMKFIFAEISYFSMWWNSTTPQNRLIVQKLLKEGRLEFVTGGWVMNDEANAHHYAMVDQMTEGNQWLEKQLGVKPEIGWFIDPFGHSSTNAYLVKKAGLKGLLIQRVHYSIKKHFARERALEFSWRQGWDSQGINDILCHMMPFYFYDIPHTCGPDPKICCQFDFNRLPGTNIRCPWGVPPQPITESNLASRAELLLDQYRKKSKLFLTNNVLIPLGDDFRYKTAREWEDQMRNYLMLFDYLNTNPQYNAKVKFATLSEYFKAVQAHPSRPSMPVVTGDFFTYADRDDHYWSGYYVSRPQYKRMDRILESKLRSAEIFYSYALARSRTHESTDSLTLLLISPDLIKALVSARRNLGLFQHHDGITGTAKTAVVRDYAERMLDAIQKCEHILAMSISCLTKILGLSDKTRTIDLKNKLKMKIPKEEDFLTSLPVFDPKFPYNPNELIRLLSGTSHTRKIYVVNSLAQEREEMVKIYVDTISICLKDEMGQPILAQINPVLPSSNSKISNIDQVEIYEVVFNLKMLPLSVKGVSIALVEAHTCPTTVLAEIGVWSSRGNENMDKIKSKFNVKVEAANGKQATFTWEGEGELVFDARTGFLQAIKSADAGLQKCALEFAYYQTAERPETSGAYLFIPSGPAKIIRVLPDKSEILTLKGPLMSRVVASVTYAYEDNSKTGDITSHFVHRLELRHTKDSKSSGIYVENDIDMRSAVNDNKEIVMRIVTDIPNPAGEFYTDLNGFQIQKRRYLQKLPIQANFYPIPTMAFLESSRQRLTLLTAQPLGVASLYQGALEVIMDRRLAQDDNRGLFQTLQDNEPYTNRFVIQLEHFPSSRSYLDPRPMVWSSLGATTLSLNLLYPLTWIDQLDHTSFSNESRRNYSDDFGNSFSLITSALPANVHLVNARTLLASPASSSEGSELLVPSKEIGFIFHTMGLDCRLGSIIPTTYQSDFLHEIGTDQMFPNIEVDQVKATTLSFTRDQERQVSAFKLRAMELQAFKVSVK